MYGTYSETYKLSASSTTDAGWPSKLAHLGLGKNGSFCNKKNWFAASLVCVGLILTLEVVGRVICYMWVWHETCNNAVCKSSCPSHRYANVQIPVVTTPFDSSCVYHCNLLVNVFTIVNYRYIVVPRINGFLCINKMKLYHFHFVVLNLFWGVYCTIYKWKYSCIV